MLPSGDYKLVNFTTGSTKSASTPTDFAKDWHLCRTVSNVNGKLWAQYFHSKNTYLLRFPDIADFFYDTEKKTIECRPCPDGDAAVVEHLLQNQVYPLAKSLQGHLVLHASAVTIGEGAVLFLGKSGAGKSTLASYFLLNGHQLVCEDGCVFSKSSRAPMIEPGQHAIRLWPDSAAALFGMDCANQSNSGARDKLYITEARDVTFSDKPQKIVAVFHMDEFETDTFHSVQLLPREALASCLNHAFLLDDRDQFVLTTHFLQLSDISNSVPHFTLSYARQYEELVRVRAAILDQCASVGVEI